MTLGEFAAWLKGYTQRIEGKPFDTDIWMIQEQLREVKFEVKPEVEPERTFKIEDVIDKPVASTITGDDPSMPNTWTEPEGNRWVYGRTFTKGSP